MFARRNALTVPSRNEVDERDVDAGAQVRRGVQRAELAERQLLGEAEAEDEPEAGKPEQRRHEAADEAVTGRHRLRGVKRDVSRGRMSEWLVGHGCRDAGLFPSESAGTGLPAIV